MDTIYREVNLSFDDAISNDDAADIIRLNLKTLVNEVRNTPHISIGTLLLEISDEMVWHFTDVRASKETVFKSGSKWSMLKEAHADYFIEWEVQGDLKENAVVFGIRVQKYQS